MQVFFVKKINKRSVLRFFCKKKAYLSIGFESYLTSLRWLLRFFVTGLVSILFSGSQRAKYASS